MPSCKIVFFLIVFCLLTATIVIGEPGANTQESTTKKPEGWPDKSAKEKAKWAAQNDNLDAIEDWGAVAGDSDALKALGSENRQQALKKDGLLKVADMGNKDAIKYMSDIAAANKMSEADIGDPDIREAMRAEFTDSSTVTRNRGAFNDYISKEYGYDVSQISPSMKIQGDQVIIGSPSSPRQHSLIVNELNKQGLKAKCSGQECTFELPAQGSLDTSGAEQINPGTPESGTQISSGTGAFTPENEPFPIHFGDASGIELHANGDYSMNHAEELNHQQINLSQAQNITHQDDLTTAETIQEGTADYSSGTADFTQASDAYFREENYTLETADSVTIDGANTYYADNVTNITVTDENMHIESAETVTLGETLLGSQVTNATVPFSFNHSLFNFSFTIDEYDRIEAEHAGIISLDERLYHNVSDATILFNESIIYANMTSGKDTAEYAFDNPRDSVDAEIRLDRGEEAIYAQHNDSLFFRV